MFGVVARLARGRRRRAVRALLPRARDPDPTLARRGVLELPWRPRATSLEEIRGGDQAQARVEYVGLRGAALAECGHPRGERGGDPLARGALLRFLVTARREPVRAQGRRGIHLDDRGAGERRRPRERQRERARLAQLA